LIIKLSVRILLVLVASAAIGVGYGRYRGVPLVPDVQQIEKKRDERSTWKQQTAISLDDFVRHYRAGKLVIDARAADQFEEKHLDAPLIMNIPAEEADQHLEGALAFLGTPIVIYCSSDDCESAETLWNAMRSWAFPMDRVRVFHPGYAGIEAAKLPTTQGPDMFQDSLASAARVTDGGGGPQASDPSTVGANEDDADADAQESNEGENP
jgi:hypothetical protein